MDKGPRIRSGLLVLDLDLVKKNDRIEHTKVGINPPVKICSQQQTERFDAWVDQRNRSIRNSAVDAFIAEVDLKLWLAPDQKDMLTVWIDKKHGQQVERRLESPQTQRQDIVMLGRESVKIRQDSNIRREVAAILRESQQNQCIRSIEPELDRLGNQ